MKVKRIRIVLAIAVVIVLFSWTQIAVAAPSDTYLSDEIQDACEKYGDEYNICPELLMAIIEAESSGDPKSKNGNCLGLMQVDKKWHSKRMKELKVSNLYDIDGNIHVGTDYLAKLIEDYEDVVYVLDIYNGNSDADYNYENGIVSKYVEKVLERSAELEELHGK